MQKLTVHQTFKVSTLVTERLLTRKGLRYLHSGTARPAVKPELHKKRHSTSHQSTSNAGKPSKVGDFRGFWGPGRDARGV